MVVMVRFAHMPPIRVLVPKVGDDSHASKESFNPLLLRLVTQFLTLVLITVPVIHFNKLVFKVVL